MQKVCISISPGIPLRGDIMIKCFHKHPSGNREPMWTTQFHTCAISNMSVVFPKIELDEANSGKCRLLNLDWIQVAVPRAGLTELA